MMGEIQMEKDFYVEIPVVLKLMVGVTAKTEEEAIEKVFDSRIAIDVVDDGETLNWVEHEWEMHDKIVQGNVFYGGINEPYVEEER
jgi:hypothetical protein